MWHSQPGYPTAGASQLSRGSAPNAIGTSSSPPSPPLAFAATASAQLVGEGAAAVAPEMLATFLHHHAGGHGLTPTIEEQPEDNMLSHARAEVVQPPNATVAQGGADVLLLDVRPFGAFHRTHIRTALSVGCSAMLQRRLARGKSRVCDLIADAQRAEFEARQQCSTVVLYDDSSTSLVASDTDALYTFMAALQREGVNAQYLHGGFDMFSLRFPELCTDTRSGGRGSLTLQLPIPTMRNASGSSLSSSAADKTPQFFVGTPDVHALRVSLCEPPSTVLPYLLLGGRRDAEDHVLLHDRGVGAVLNVTQAEHVQKMPGVRYKQLPVLDTWHQNIERFFAESYDFIESARLGGHVVMVHCSAGISRSATIVIAYLMRKNMWTLDQAYSHVRAVRPVISPNLDFMGHLLHYERMLVSGADLSSGGASPSLVSGMNPVPVE